MRPVATIPRDKFQNFAHKLVKELSGNYSVNKIDRVESLNRQLAGWANFYQFTGYTAVMYGKLDRIIFWKLAHWLARKYRTSIKLLMRQWVRRPADGKAKIWQLWSRANIRGLVHHSDRGSQYLSIRYSDKLAEAGIDASAGRVGDSYDHALAETIDGSYKTEVIRHRGPWKNLDKVEYATLNWVDWFNNRRILEPIGNIPPTEYELMYYQHLEQSSEAA